MAKKRPSYIKYKGLFIKYNVNYLSHTTLVTGNKSLAKSIVWIPDFQYLYFPEFFSRSERAC